MMPYPQFRELVKRMRFAQRRFFRSRDPQHLDDAKFTERQIDAELLHGDSLFDEDDTDRSKS